MNTWRACFGTVGVLLVLSCRISAQDDLFSVGTLRAATAATDEFESPPACAAGQLAVCVGCKKIKICTAAASDADNPKQLCPTDMPYCNSDEGGVCSVNPDSKAECVAAVPVFNCTATGMFPDPYSCTGYYFCESIGAPGDAYKCDPGYNYNSKVQLCQRGFTGCQVANCTGVTAIFTTYFGNPQYFYYCKANPDDATAPKQPVMFSCGIGATLNAKQSKCIYKCPREGLFKKDGSPSSYFQCAYTAGVLVSQEKKCPTAGQVFDDTKKTCVKGPATTTTPAPVASLRKLSYKRW
ncbi:hypothetical protein pipiens_007251 [Culex pipiens pipiens]|uniref:Chitin-binding type-2 domain-containing protein n=1 Tax=Culex pipiens pipiens TaxID=38569 RepID=A0ABD1DLX0_CULPP